MKLAATTLDCVNLFGFIRVTGGPTGVAALVLPSHALRPVPVAAPHPHAWQGLRPGPRRAHPAPRPQPQHGLRRGGAAAAAAGQEEGRQPSPGRPAQVPARWAGVLPLWLGCVVVCLSSE